MEAISAPEILEFSQSRYLGVASGFLYLSLLFH